MSKFLIGPFLAWAKTLRYPTLFKLTAALFAFSLLLPPGIDPIPLLDEVVLALGTLLLANWHRRKESPDGPVVSDTKQKPPIEGQKVS